VIQPPPSEPATKAQIPHCILLSLTRLQAQALELSMGMSGDFEQAIAMCVKTAQARKIRRPL
jgi:uncharacterized pyridoxal phosphate-containing UPF0001 family protein